MTPTRTTARRWCLAGVATALLATAGGLAYWLPRRPAPDSDPAPPAGPPWFADVSDAVGLAFVHDPGPADGRYFMPQIVGSGLALFDADGDGRLDLYLINNGGPAGRPNAFYHQRPDGTFEDASRGSGLDVSGYGMGAAAGDVNNDGRPDLAVTEYGRLRLFVNGGEGRFAEAPAGGLDSPLWGTSCAFFDYDRDGWLDLAVANYVNYDPSRHCADGGNRDYCHPKVFQGTVARLFHNVTGRPAAPVRFEDVTVPSGLARSPGPGLGVACADFTGDGWPDVFVANDGHANHLWVNQGNGTFREEAVSRGLAYDGVGRPLANMGVALGDVHGTGRFDLFVTHLPEETNTLWRQESRGLFVDATAPSGLARPRWRATGFGTVSSDFNLDGELDVGIVNGRVVRAKGDGSPASFWDAYAERNQLFAGEGGGQFRDISPDTPDLCGTPNVARGLAVGDLDGDGALDLVYTCIGGRTRVLRNVAPNRGHWLSVRAVDPRLRRDAYGAEVTVAAGGWRRVAWVNPGQSYLSSCEPTAHFGLGSSTAVEDVRVRWPDGTVEQFPGGPADRALVLRKGEGTALPPEPTPKPDRP